MKTVFATVGTTSFDELIESVTSSEAAQVLKARGYERLVLQVGRGSVFPATDSCPHIKLEAFRFKDSIAEDIKQADLVISHAGVKFGSLVPVKGTLNASAYQDILDNVMLSTLWEKFGDGPFLFQHDCAPLHKAGAGSCLEALGAGKPLLVVVNDKLMDNHQLELARQLHMDSHLLYCTCSTLTETLRTMDLSVLQPFPPGQPKNFADFLDKALGVK